MFLLNRCRLNVCYLFCNKLERLVSHKFVSEKIANDCANDKTADDCVFV